MAHVIKMPTNNNAAAEACFQRAVRFFTAGKINDAINGYAETLQHNPGYGPGWINLAVALRQIGKFDASAAASERALEIAPNNAFALMNYGNCLVDLNRLDEAVAALSRAVALNPKDFKVRRNYSIALREAGRFDEALALFQTLQKEQPDDITLKWEEALTFLQTGDYKNGWNAFEIRWKLPGMRELSSKTAKRWAGQDLKGKTILIYDEQGLGDAILCSRYISLIAARGGRILLECKPPLHKLLSTLPGVARVGDVGQLSPLGFDYHIPMMSLPGIFGTDLSNIPSAPPLHIAPSLPPEAARRLALGNGRFKVGIVWSGSTTFANNRKRAVDISRFLPLVSIPGVQLYSLQKGPLESDLTKSGMESLILPLGPHVNDFSETAAVVNELDLVIMTDSSVAHLAGSLGVPVWNLLCYRPYWLYLTDRADTPWYPSMRLFRQPKAGDWESVFAEVARELESLVISARAPERKRA